MPLSISLFPDIDGLDGLISETETVLAVYLAALAIMLVIIVVGECLERERRRSPVERILREGFWDNGQRCGGNVTTGDRRMEVAARRDYQ